MITIRLQEKQGKKMVDVTGNLPESWSEMTIGQYLDFKTVDVNDAGRFLEIFTGIPKNIFYKAPATDVNEQLLGKLAWLSKTKANLENLPIPKTVIIGGMEMVIPTGLIQESWGQALLLDQVMMEHGKDMSFAIPRVIAIYMQPKVHGGEFQIERVDEVEALIRRTTPLENAWAVGCFFLKKRMQSPENGMSS